MKLKRNPKNIYNLAKLTEDDTENLSDPIKIKHRAILLDQQVLPNTQGINNPTLNKFFRILFMKLA